MDGNFFICLKMEISDSCNQMKYVAKITWIKHTMNNIISIIYL